MGQPAAVTGDRVVATCNGHVMPGPSGSPSPAPPLPFSAPLTSGGTATVLIGDAPAAVVGTNGLNVPPHVGLHPTDPHAVPTMQRAQIVSGSATVLFESKPAAHAGSRAVVCLGQPGQLVASRPTVLIGD